MSSSTVNKQKRGRPPGGHNGKRVHDYPALLVRLRRHIEEILAAVAEVTNLSRTRVIFRALVMSKLKYLRDHQPLVEKRVDAAIKARRDAEATRSDTSEEI
jgi:hypothetical protein